MQHICIAKNTLHRLRRCYCSHSHLAAHLGIYCCSLSEFRLCLFTGQFWNIPLKIEPYVGQYGERLVDLMDRFYSLTVSYPNAPERTFVAKYDERDWFDNRPCLYAGNADGGRVSEVPSSDSVIEGTASSYVVQDLFSADFEFSKYNRDC